MSIACKMTNCARNDDGYCTKSDYVTIDEGGECDLMWPLTNSKDHSKNKEDEA